MGWSIKAMRKNKPPNCDICGRFVSFVDIMSGKAKLKYMEWGVDSIDGPDIYEGFEVLCSEHNKKKVT